MILRIEGSGYQTIKLDNLSDSCQRGVRNGLRLAQAGSQKVLYTDHLLAGLLALYTESNIFLARQGLSYDALIERGFKLPERNIFKADSKDEEFQDVEISSFCASDLHSAIRAAERLEVATVEPEYILASNLRRPQAADVVYLLQQLGIDPGELNNKLEHYIERESKRKIRLAPAIITPN